MFTFVFQKIWSKKWMIVSLLLGNLLMVSIASAGPLYSNAALQRTLTRNLSTYYVETNRNPGMVHMPNNTSVTNATRFDRIAKSSELFDQLMRDWNVPVLENVTQYEKNNLRILPEVLLDGENVFNVRLHAYTDMESHIQIIKGEMYSKELNDHTFEVIVSERTFQEQKLMLGEVFKLPDVKDADGKNYYIQVTGIFQNNDPQDLYWVEAPAALRDVFFMDAELFQKLLYNEEYIQSGAMIERYAFLDYTALEKDQVEAYLDSLDTCRHNLEEFGQTSLKVNFEETLSAFVSQAKKANTTIWVLLLPIFVLLAVFIFMVSRQMLEMEQNEIAIYKSRGANKGQIIGIYLLQSGLIAVLSLAGGIPLGVLICRVLGATNSFLEFVNRAALPIEMDPEVLLVAAGAAFVSVCTMVLPVFRYSNVNIVAHKRKKNRSDGRSVWEKIFLDVIALGVSGYGLYQYNAQKEFLAQQVAEGASLNPLLYLYSSIFMVGAGLLILRIFPWIVRFIFWLGEKWWTPSQYTSFLRIIRTKSNQGFLMVFLILTVAMGIYNSQAARTINANTQERIQYITGADLVLQEVWNKSETGSGIAAYSEPDFEKYRMMEDAESVTRVYADNEITVSLKKGKLEDVVLMGIHTKEFGQTAWFKEGLLPNHQNAYLNAMSQNAQAILVSSNFREELGCRLGDVISYSDDQKHTMRGIIYGFVDYWPGYAPKVLYKGTDGVYQERDNYLIVANLAQLQSSWGIMPYEIWIKTAGSSGFIYEFAQESGTEYVTFEDAAAELIEAKNDPVLQGTNGILTIGFICILMLCTIGFLIFWILSIQSRTLQFGVFRAMGMSMREILNMLINEHIFITGVSLAAGVLVGAVASRLFIPLIQLAYSSADQVLPLEIVSQSGDYVRLFSVIGVVILLCMVILGWLISKIKISQALKLGED